MVADKGNTILTLSEADKAAWTKACEPVTESWVAEMQGKGIDGAALIAAAKNLLANTKALDSVSSRSPRNAPPAGSE